MGRLSKLSDDGLADKITRGSLVGEAHQTGFRVVMDRDIAHHPNHGRGSHVSVHSFKLQTTAPKVGSPKGAKTQGQADQTRSSVYNHTGGGGGGWGQVWEGKKQWSKPPGNARSATYASSGDW